MDAGDRNVGSPRWAATALLCLVAAASPGCAFLNGFLDPTKVGHFGFTTKEIGIRRVLTVHETPPGIPGASEPTPEDLIPDRSEYRVIPGDVIAISIDDLVNQGQQEVAQLRVNTAGYIRLPILSTVKVSGLSEKEIEDEVKTQLIAMNHLVDPQVRVTIAQPIGRTYTFAGSVGAPGQYPLFDPGMRLLDAIGQARDISANIKKLYIIRQKDPLANRIPPGETSRPEDELIIPPPADPDEDYSSFSSPVGLNQEQGSGQDKKRDSDLDELMDAVAPPGASRPPQEQPAQDRDAAPERPFKPLIIDPVTGEIRPADGVGAQGDTARDSQTGDQPSEPFDWDEPGEEESSQRVIEIDVLALRRGDPRYNIVIRNRDFIEVPVSTGIFYLMGEVNRPGVYGLGGRDITVKQAIALAAGFSPLAWPQRCEVIRRKYGSDEEMIIPVNLDAIFAGIEQDFLLRDEDILNVGTHFVAPFLFVIRNSFRFTYGFGFVYDRNFADKDSFSVQANPNDLARIRRQQRGLPF